MRYLRRHVKNDHSGNVEENSAKSPENLALIDFEEVNAENMVSTVSETETREASIEFEDRFKRFRYGYSGREVFFHF